MRSLQARLVQADGQPVLAISVLDTGIAIDAPEVDRTRYYTLEQTATALALVYPNQEPVHDDTAIRKALIQAAHDELLANRSDQADQELTEAYVDLLLRNEVFPRSSRPGTEPTEGTP